MILAITAVNESKIESCLEDIHRFENGIWDIHILTNQPEKFAKWTTHYYENNVFSFFDKLLFPFRLSNKMKKPVVSIDADDLKKPTLEFINNFVYTKKINAIMYPSEWPNCEDKTLEYIFENRMYLMSQTRIRYAIQYWGKLGFNYNILRPVWEWMLYIPYSENNIKIIHELELIQPIFEIGTILSNIHYYGENNTFGTVFGSEEGLALSYALEKHFLTYEKFNPIYIKS